MNSSLPTSKKGRPSGCAGGARPLFLLGNRLALCASLVRRGTALADVGTDHAYLPVWLAKRGLVRSAVAADIRPGPLKRAAANISRYGVGGVVSVRLSDGLARIAPEEAEDVVIAGMGGLMMIHILERTPWLREPERRLILQPMTSVEELRAYLAREGFFTMREQAAEEGNHIYTVMQVSFGGEKRRAGDLFCWIGNMTAETAEGRKYLLVQKRRMEKRANGLFHSGNRAEAERLFRLAAELADLLAPCPDQKEGRAGYDNNR